jgi:lysozyme family protein
MAIQTFDEALRRLLAHEGGYSNHPSDPGGPTNFGITLADYRRYIDNGGSAADVRRMSVEQAKAIYRSKYWNAMRCGELPAGVDYAVFDYGVNSGLGRAPKVLKRVLGLDAASSVVTDTVIAAAKRRAAKAVVNAICDERLRFLKSLRTWPVFGKGWDRRVKQVRAAALAMAAQPTAAPALPPNIDSRPAPGRGEVPADKLAKEAIRTGIPITVAAGGYAWWNWIVAHPAPTVALLVVIAGAMTILLGALEAWRRQKQESPADAAVTATSRHDDALLSSPSEGSEI